jgi:hypothetical protein
MASSLNGTGITFSNATTLSSAPVTTFVGQTGAVDPTVIGSIGSTICGCYIVTLPGNVNAAPTTTTYAIGTTIAGSSLAYDIKIYGTRSGGSSTASYIPMTHADVWLAMTGSATNGRTFPVSGTNYGSAYGFTTPYIASTGTTVVVTYSTMSGSWRSLSGFSDTSNQNSCGAEAHWLHVLWTRYA